MRNVDPARRQRRRDTILDAAERVLMGSGLHGASMAMICREAGMSPGHVYHYFESKTVILAALSERILDVTAACFEAGGRDRDSIGAIKAFIDSVRCDAAPGRRGFVLDLYAEAHRDPAIAAIVTQHAARLRALMIEQLRAGQRSGQIAPHLVPETAASALLLLVDGGKLSGVREPGHDERVVRAAVHRLVDAVIAFPGPING